MVNPILNWTDDDFNSHARVGRDANRAVDPDVSPDFNSHARVGRDMSECKLPMNIMISTHTPV